MSKTKLTKAMRKVLERMEGCVIFSDNCGRMWWGDKGNPITKRWARASENCKLESSRTLGSTGMVLTSVEGKIERTNLDNTEPGPTSIKTRPPSL